MSPDRPPQRGDVFWVAFDPSIGGEIRKTRRAVVVSNDVANHELNRIQVVPITSNVGRLYPSEAYVTLNGQQRKAMADQLSTVSKLRLRQRRGRLAGQDMEDLRTAWVVSQSGSMFDFLKRKPRDPVEALTNQAIGGQSVMYRLFREGLGCDDSAMRRLELTYFAAAVMTFVYLRLGKEPNRERILDSFSQRILEKSIMSSREKLSLDESIKQYQQRYIEYDSLLNLLFHPENSTSGRPATTLLMHFFECVTGSTARGHMIQITAASELMQEFVRDHIDFVNKEL